MHMIKVNGMSRGDVLDIIEQAFEEWEDRNEVEWKLDLSYLEALGC